MPAPVFPELPLPPHYDSANAARWDHRPDEEAMFAAACAWASQHGIAPAAADRRRIHLLLIDVQKDFCFPQGSLYVGGRDGRGAMADNDRIARFIYRNLPSITDITCTMDTHYPFQIFFPSFWLDREGRPPPPHREITTEHIRTRQLRPAPAAAAWLCGGDLAWLERQVEHYCAELERAGRYRLYLWPLHCLLGSEGHVLAGVIQEARLFHAFARGARNWIEIKGGHPLSENYSVFAPEVLTRWDGQVLAERNTRLLRELLAADALLIAGQAASHCVKSSIDDLLDEIGRLDPALAGRVYVLTDCMSAVAVPDPQQPGEFLVDFTPQVEAALRRYAEAGMHLVRSTEPLSEWPGLGG
ncbi:MAG: nicotinamidase [Myxococcales bacterium]|nr:nicotinamidase [Myxococcota bacterium]MDW8281122.1 nicotinamidase [Myxococcales bacterium]